MRQHIMELRYHEDTDSFFFSFGGGKYQHSFPVSDHFIVDLDWYDRVRAVESIWATRDLETNDIIANPPMFKWVTPADGEPTPLRANDRVRYFIHRPAQDSVYMEFALGDPVDTEPVIDGVYAELNAAGGVAGLHIANASRNLDLDSILADGPPVIEWVPHPAAVVSAGVAGS